MKRDCSRDGDQCRWMVWAALCSRWLAWTAGAIADWSHSPWWSVPYSRRSGCWRLPDDSRDGRAISLVVHDASSVCASLGVERSSLCTGSVVWTVRDLAAFHGDTVSSEAGSHDCHRSTASGTAEPPPDSHGDGGLETLSAVQRGRRLHCSPQRTGRAAHW